MAQPTPSKCMVNRYKHGTLNRINRLWLFIKELNENIDENMFNCTRGTTCMFLEVAFSQFVRHPPVGKFAEPSGFNVLASTPNWGVSRSSN